MRLGEYLQLADISQTRFAALLGVQQATVSRYISGTKIPSATVVLKIRDLSKGAVALDDWAPLKKRRRDALLPGG
jgi:predicted transcriptional regulator